MTAEEFPYTHYMTLKEWKRFVKNYKNRTPHFYGVNLTLKDYLLEYSTMPFRLIIIDAFRWDESPEGEDYWHKIYQRTQPIQQ